MKSKKIYLTFDMDWACDEVLRYFMKLMSKLGVPYTINVTHKTDLLDELRKDKNVELGIHPNFNNLLAGETVARANENSFIDVIKNIKDIVPEAITARSHSLVDGTPISLELSNLGIKYSLNVLVWPKKGISFSYWHDFTGLYKIPFCYEDDIWFGYDYYRRAEEYLNENIEVPLVFNFHPIHIYLNTDCIETYRVAKPFLSTNGSDLSHISEMINCDKYGAKDWLLELVEIGKKKGYCFKKICEGDWE